MRKSISVIKSFEFALRIIQLYKSLIHKNEFVLSKQILKSGTSIGAQIAEAEYAQSRPDFIHKFSIGIKEANETLYWLRLLYHSGQIEKDLFKSLESDCNEILKLLTSSLNTAKGKLVKR